MLALISTRVTHITGRNGEGARILRGLGLDYKLHILCRFMEMETTRHIGWWASRVITLLLME